MANSVDPDQTALSGTVWSRSVLFAFAILSATLVYESLEHLQHILFIFFFAEKSVFSRTKETLSFLLLFFFSIFFFNLFTVNTPSIVTNKPSK